MKKIKLTQGKHALVDDDDFEFLNQWRWCAHKQRNGIFYAVRSSDTKQKRMMGWMHRIVLNTSKGMETDHINNDGLDNRKINLRVCTRSENLCNRARFKNNTSGFKGVSWYKPYEKWTARITVNQKTIFLGYFNDLQQAALAYNKAAVKHQGEFAQLNCLAKLPTERV